MMRRIADKLRCRPWAGQIVLANAVIILTCFMTVPGAFAHPHVWVKMKTELLFDAHHALTGFRHKWTFDEAYSEFAVEGLDTNHDGKYDSEELKELAEVNISSLKEFDYFTYPKLGEDLLDRSPPEDYVLEYHDNMLTLSFTLPLAEALPSAKFKNFRFSVYDPTYYVDFGLAKQNPIMMSGAPEGCKPAIKDPPSTDQTSLANAQFSGSWGEQYASIVSLQCPAS